MSTNFIYKQILGGIRGFLQQLPFNDALVIVTKAVLHMETQFHEGIHRNPTVHDVDLFLEREEKLVDACEDLMEHETPLCRFGAALRIFRRVLLDTVQQTPHVFTRENTDRPYKEGDMCEICGEAKPFPMHDGK